MLPPGHIAGGYLTATALLHFSGKSVTPAQQTQLLWWGMFFGFAPDLDMFYWFARSGSFKADPAKGDHRKYYSHAPVLWLIPGLLIFLASQNPFWKQFGLVVWLCSWSHFILDSIQYGIMWLWPLSNKVYALFPAVYHPNLEKSMSESAEKDSLFKYWLTFLKEYAKALKISLICELILVAVTLIIYFK